MFIQAARGHQPESDGRVFARNLKAAKNVSSDDTSYYAWMTTGSTMSHRDWLKWNEVRQQMRLKWSEFFKDYDLLLCPAAATAAFPHNQKGERWERMVMVNGKPAALDHADVLGRLLRAW